MAKLSDIYRNYSAPDGCGDKGTAHSYIEIYEQEITKTDNIDLLEIGVLFGHSIKMWEEYFTNSRVYGVDIFLGNVQFDCQNLYLCDATSEHHINSLFSDKQFDYIIDDGSHLVLDQIESFKILWSYMKPNGKYFIEDIANDFCLQKIIDFLNQNSIDYTLFDRRPIKNRSDDILLMMVKPS